MYKKKENKKGRIFLFFVLLPIIILISFWLDINAGYNNISFQDMLSLINGEASKTVTLTMMNFRLPRVIMSLLVGVGLSVSGCVLQGVSRNELADPGILGINAGAGFAVALYITIFARSLTNASIILFVFALLGSILTISLVYILSYSKNDGLTPERMLLTGISITIAINALTILLLLRMRQSEYGFVANWISGNIWGATWGNIAIVATCIIILLFLVFYKARTLDVLGLGNQTAIGLGVFLKKENIILLGAAVGLSGICVAVGGGISFVGLVCPHLARKLVGPKHRLLIMASALIGAALMVISDIISRTILAPNEVAIGIVATILGSPYFIYLLATKKGGR